MACAPTVICSELRKKELSRQYCALNDNFGHINRQVSLSLPILRPDPGIFGSLCSSSRAGGTLDGKPGAVS